MDDMNAIPDDVEENPRPFIAALLRQTPSAFAIMYNYIEQLDLALEDLPRDGKRYLVASYLQVGLRSVRDLMRDTAPYQDDPEPFLAGFPDTPAAETKPSGQLHLSDFDEQTAAGLKAFYGQTNLSLTVMAYLLRQLEIEFASIKDTGFIALQATRNTISNLIQCIELVQHMKAEGFELVD